MLLKSYLQYMNHCLRFMVIFLSVAFMMSCNFESPQHIPELQEPMIIAKDSPSSIKQMVIFNDSSSIAPIHQTTIEIVAFAKTFIGIPYLFGSTDPTLGFDCSGFITYVFNHFNMEVPRSSIGFTNVGTAIKITEAVTGDLILFTGTDTLENFVGHMGIITENTDSLRFIHATSGKKNGVTITALNHHYLQRFVKVIRIF